MIEPQTVGKALRVLCIRHGLEFARVHDIGYLLDLLVSHGLELPEQLNSARILTSYAVTTRYPGEYAPITEEEYLAALRIAEVVYMWIEQRLED